VASPDPDQLGASTLAVLATALLALPPMLLLLPLLLAEALGTGEAAAVAATPCSSVSLSVPPVVTAMLLVLRRVGLRVLRVLPTLAVLVPDSSPQGLPWRLGMLLLLLLPAAAAAGCRAEGRTLNVAPPTRSLTTAMLFSVNVPVLSLQQHHSMITYNTSAYKAHTSTHCITIINTL
jgi:hypothetical protein